MSAAYALAALALLLAMGAGLYRAVIGPSLPDRVLAMNAFGSMTVVLIVVLGFLGGVAHLGFADVALLYALINFVGTIALLKFFQFNDLGYTESEVDE